MVEFAVSGNHAMMKTANLIGSISRSAGGLHESVRRLVQCLAEQGVGVQVIGLKDEFTEEDAPLWKPIHITTHRRWPPKFFGFSAGFHRSVREYKPDLLHTHGIWQYPSIVTASFSYRNSLPYMISPHGMLDPWAINHHRWRKAVAYAFYEYQHLRGASCIRALCDSEAQSIRKLGLSNPIAVIPNGIDLPDPSLTQNAQQANPFSSFVGNGTSTKVLLYLGRIHPKKGLANLLHAWKIMRSKIGSRKREEWVLAIAGWDQGGHESELKSLANDLGIPWVDNRDLSDVGNGTNASAVLKQRSSRNSLGVHLPSIVFMGPQFGQDKAACYANCDGFILPSFSEGLPMVILEAWAYGKPVVMTPECNLPEGFTANAAFSIETNAESIAECLCSFSELPDSEMEAAGHRGFELVRNRFTWPSVANQLKVTYEWMLGGAPAPNWMFTG